jgi:hypothetical protein
MKSWWSKEQHVNGALWQFRVIQWRRLRSGLKKWQNMRMEITNLGLYEFGFNSTLTYFTNWLFINLIGIFIYFVEIRKNAECSDYSTITNYGDPFKIDVQMIFKKYKKIHSIEGYTPLFVLCSIHTTRLNQYQFLNFPSIVSNNCHCGNRIDACRPSLRE